MIAKRTRKKIFMTQTSIFFFHRIISGINKGMDWMRGEKRKGRKVGKRKINFCERCSAWQSFWNENWGRTQSRRFERQSIRCFFSGLHVQILSRLSIDSSLFERKFHCLRLNFKELHKYVDESRDCCCRWNAIFQSSFPFHIRRLLLRFNNVSKMCL